MQTQFLNNYCHQNVAVIRYAWGNKSMKMPNAYKIKRNNLKS